MKDKLRSCKMYHFFTTGKKEKSVERKCPRTLEALTAERTMSRQRNINPAPSAAPLFLTDATEPAHSSPLVHEHGGFQRVEDAGWKTEVASQEHFSSPPNKVLKKRGYIYFERHAWDLKALAF